MDHQHHHVLRRGGASRAEAQCLAQLSFAVAREGFKVKYFRFEGLGSGVLGVQDLKGLRGRVSGLWW